MLDFMRRFLQRSFVKNTSWIFLGQVLSLGVQMLYFVLLARLLGSQQYGIYVGAVALVALFSQYGSLGSGLVFLQYVSADASRAREFWGNIVLSSLLFGPAFLLLAALLGHGLLHNGQPWLVIIVAVSDCLCGSLITSMARIFQTFEQMQFTAGITLSGNLARLGVAIFLFVTQTHATATQWAIGALLASSTVTIISIVIVLVRVGRPRISFRQLRPHLKEGVVFSMSDSTSTIYNDTDKIIMAHLGMNRANGAYSLAYRAINVASIPFIALYSAAQPKFFREGVKGAAATLPYARKLLRPAIPIGIAISIILFFSAPLLPMIVGKDFQTSVYALRGLCLIPLFRAFQWCAGDAVAGAGRQSIRFMLQLVAAGFNFGANLYLIPKYSWVGAVWSSLATDGLLAVALWCALLWLSRKPTALQA